MFYHFEMRTYIFNIFIEKYSEAYFENVHMIILVFIIHLGLPDKVILY